MACVALATVAVVLHGPASGADSTTTTTTTTTTVPVTTTTLAPVRDPFASRGIARYLASLTSEVTAALYDASTGRTYLYNPGVREVTASMGKIDILGDLLYENQQDDRAMTPADNALATAMIEDSNNKDAQTLFIQTGQLPAMTTFDGLLGYTQTELGWDWGEFATTPLDELRLLRAIVFPNRVLDAASRDYEQDLMEHVVDYQRFGVPTGVPADATVGVKNGWYPETATGWQLNTAGYVHLGHCFYLAVVMTAYNPNEDYGLDTVNTVSHMLWNYESTLYGT